MTKPELRSVRGLLAKAPTSRGPLSFFRVRRPATNSAKALKFHHLCRSLLQTRTPWPPPSGWKRQQGNQFGDSNEPGGTPGCLLSICPNREGSFYSVLIPRMEPFSPSTSSQNIFFFLFFFFFFPRSQRLDLGSQFPDQESDVGHVSGSTES